MSTHGTRSHPAGIGGVRVRTTHYSKPPIVDPTVEGMPSYKAREGEAIQVPDLGEQIIETGHFDYGAAAPQVNNNPLAPSDAEVVIDTEGIHIKNGKMFLEDYGGNSVLGPAGFDGSWIDFLSTGVYNGRFRSGAVAPPIADVTVVGTANTSADYEASLSVAVPHWVIDEVTDAGYQIADLPLYGRAVSMSKSGPAQGVFSLFQDVPARWNGIRSTIIMLDFIMFTKESAVGDKVELFVSELDANHQQVVGGQADALWDSWSFPTAGTWPVFNELGDITLNPATQYLRVRVKATLGATAAIHSSAFSLLGVNVQQAVSSDALYLRQGGGVWWRNPQTNSTGLLEFTDGASAEYRFRYSSDSSDARVQLRSSPVGSAPGYFEVQNDSESEPTVRIGWDGSSAMLAFGPGGAVAPDVSVARAAAGVLSIQGLRLAGAGTSFPASPSSGDLFYRTDLGFEFQYDGTRWLSTVAFTAPFVASTLSANGWSEEALAFRQVGGQSIWIDQAYVFLSVATTHSNTNKWILKTYDQGTGDRVTLLDSWATSPSVGGGGGYAINSIGYLSGVGPAVIRMSLHCTKSGAPGDLTIRGGFRYRLVAS